MTDTHTAPGTSSTAIPRRDGNAVDVHYLEHTRAALGPIMAASSAASSQATRHGVRALARVAFTEQTDQLATISAVLLAWGRPAVTGPRTTVADATPSSGSDLDQVFADLLTAHAHASLAAARVEMVAGASHAARPIAEAAIHKHDRRLAAIDELFPPTPREG
jgi:uncharacterized protein (DUF305 family)